MPLDIKKRREELGLTMEDVGHYVGVGKGTVAKWESGFIKNMRRDKIVKLAEVLRVSPMDFLTTGINSHVLLVQKKAPLCEELKYEYKKLILSVFEASYTEPSVVVQKGDSLILLNTQNEDIQAILKNI